MLAYCDRKGIIEFGNGVCPSGKLPIARHRNEQKLRDIVEVVARHSRTDETLFVPGIPEANSDEAALDALIEFQTQVQKRLGSLAA